MCLFFFFQAEDGIRDAQESRGLGDVYKRQTLYNATNSFLASRSYIIPFLLNCSGNLIIISPILCVGGMYFII